MKSLAVALTLCACSFQPPRVADDGAADAGTVATDRCATTVDDATVSLFSFHNVADITDAVSSRAGAVQGDLVAIPGPSGCGNAVELSAVATSAMPSYVEIANATAWQLSEGSIDVWIRASDSGMTYGLVSRDAQGTATTGHLTMFLAPAGFVVARLQNPDGVALRCSNQIVPGDTWTHIEFNFGPPGVQLHVDGVLAERTDTFRSFGVMLTCGTGDTTQGIAGNANPWVVGVASALSNEAAATPVHDPFTGGAIDELRISRVRRDLTSR